jgi:hypothetical protein
MAHIVADWIKETASNKPDGSTAFNLPDTGYTGGYGSFDSVLATGDTCFYTATNTVARETGLGTFTAGSPDTLTRTTILSSSTGSAIDWSSGGDVTVELVDPARQVGQSWLAHVAGTDADTTMVANHMYVVDMSAWATADRTYTLPAAAVAGDRVGIMVTAGDASHELIITANTGDTLNGISGGTEWSRLFITGEVVIMRCTADAATWIVEYDGRIPCFMMLRTTNATSGTQTGGTFYAPTATTGSHGAATWTAEVNIGSAGTTADGRFTARRANNGLIVTAKGTTANALTDGNYAAVFAWNGTTSYVTSQISVGGTAVVPNFAGAGTFPPQAVGAYAELIYRTQESNKYLAGGAFFGVKEILN